MKSPRIGGGHKDNALQQARIRAGMSQRAAAIALACDVRTLQRYESGELSPTRDMMMKMKDCYSCSLLDLFPAE